MRIDYDKALHGNAGAIAALAGVLAARGGLPLAGSLSEPLAAILACALAALGREAWGVARGRPWDWNDVGATMLGGLLVAIAAY